MEQGDRDAAEPPPGAPEWFFDFKSIRFQWTWKKIGRGDTSGCPASSYINNRQVFEQTETLRK